jgi:hypothetical protein
MIERAQGPRERMGDEACPRCRILLPVGVAAAECPLCQLRDADAFRVCQCSRPVLLRRYVGAWLCLCRGTRDAAA